MDQRGGGARIKLIDIDEAMQPGSGLCPLRYQSIRGRRALHRGRISSQFYRAFATLLSYPAKEHAAKQWGIPHCSRRWFDHENF
jgi:hypothetical protein